MEEGIRLLVVAPIYLSIDSRLLPGLFHARQHELTIRVRYRMISYFFFLFLSFLESQKSDKFYLSHVNNDFEDKEITLKDKDVYVSCTMNKAKILIYNFKNHAILEVEDAKERMGLKMKRVRRHGEHS